MWVLLDDRLQLQGNQPGYISQVIIQSVVEMQAIECNQNYEYLYSYEYARMSIQIPQICQAEAAHKEESRILWTDHSQ